MFSSSDEAQLLRALSRNDALLFLGAGFSSGATNRLDQNLPNGPQLARGLWRLLRYDGDHDSTPLPQMFEAALQEGIPHQRLRTFLEERLLVTGAPSYYDNLSHVYWYRIYTTNIDNLVTFIYTRSRSQRLQVLAYPRSDIAERDQTLERIQSIHLNGALPCSIDDVTLSVNQYARRAGELSPLYDQFVRDYAVKPTIFIGTDLNEPLLWQHIEARERRGFGLREYRPRSFLIAPTISRPKRAQLKNFNVVPVEGTAKDFLRWLAAKTNVLPDKHDVLGVTTPSLINLLERVGRRPPGAPHLAGFSQAFHLVLPTSNVGEDRSFYLLGASPRWEDIYRDLDAPRHMTTEILAYVQEALDDSTNSFAQVVSILGSAGSGKSTILRRLGIMLSRAGRTTFLTNSETLPKLADISASLASFRTRCVLLLDNAEIALTRLSQLVEETRDMRYPPLFVLASRTNDFHQRAARLEATADIKEWTVPDLTEDEIIGVIQTLDKNGLLGKLQGLSQAARIEEFSVRADRQLLVAMREATKGKGFDEIIADEFNTLASIEVKHLYLCTALATEAGYRITTQQFVACGNHSAAQTLNILNRNLKGIVVPTGPKKDLLLLRHRLIAGYVLDKIATRSLLGTAYRKLLRVLAPEIQGQGRRGRNFGLYRELVHHQSMHRRFSATVDEARAVYDSIRGYVAEDLDYWLQYGLLELEFGHLELAENYLYQAESLYPRSNYVRNSIGQLTLQKAIEAGNVTEAMQLREEGSKLLQKQMDNSDSPYPYHIYGAKRLRWARKWLKERDGLRKELEHLREVMRRGRRRYGRNHRLRVLDKEVNEEYLWLATGETNR